MPFLGVSVGSKDGSDRSVEPAEVLRITPHGGTASVSCATVELHSGEPVTGIRTGAGG